jgi:hypothetical protein
VVWDWWISSHCTDEYGNLYIGYVDESGFIGVLQKKPDGTTISHRLARTANNDDHNGAAVNLLSDGRLIVCSASGHSKDNKLFVLIAKESNTVSCEFSMQTVKLRQPSGYTYKTAYSQIFVNGDNVNVFFRCVVSHDGSNQTTWCSIRSANSGESWSLIRGIKQADLYARIVGTGDTLRVCFTKNPINTTNWIRSGVVDLANSVIKDNSGTTVASMSTVTNGLDDGTTATPDLLITESVPFVSDVLDADVEISSGRIRLLDVYPSTSGVSFIYASAIDSSLLNFKYYRRTGGQDTEVGESGKPFYLYSSYLPGAVFGNSVDDVVMCQNISGESDGAHDLIYAKITSGNIEKKTIASCDKMLIRPLFYNGGFVAVCIGIYNDTSTTSATGSFQNWKLMPLFETAS